MSEVGRRRFFGTLLAGTAAAEMLADVPEPQKVERIEPSSDSVFVLSYAGMLSQKAVARLKESWEAAFAPGKAPKVIILEDHLKIQMIPKSALPLD